MTKERRIPSSRLGRFSQLGRLAGGMVGGMVSEGARQLASGKRPALGDLLLTPSNARRLAERLSEMRGAAMKIGQLLSMDSGQILPPQLGEILTRLREDAHRMPLGQVAQVLDASLGKQWKESFERFDFTPIAAASIGQVHRAVLKDGREVAIKIQYPGIEQSIDSDIGNVAMLLKLSGMLPDGMDLEPLLEEARQQLHHEADYEHEADLLRRFHALLEEDERFTVPGVVDELSSKRVLTMEFLHGDPIESIEKLESARRNEAARRLTELAFREVFEWGLVQTDPNFANYLHDAATGRIQLLDFGAAREHSDEKRAAMRRLLHACMENADQAILDAAAAVGYLGDDDPDGYAATVLQLLRTATEPLRADKPYRFGHSDLAVKMGEIVREMRLESRYSRIPPMDILFLHRKLGGLYLLLSRLNARLDIGELARPYLDDATIATAGQVA
jgi:predicted unusual protein kinase regulating ubiquinone biosynthesis (AarF/ABC1/UbiB family)